MQRDPFGDRAASQRLPVLLGQRHERAVGPVRAGRRASVSSISASSPATSPSSGSSRCSQPGQPDRLGGQVGAVQVGPERGGVALVEDQVEHLQHRPRAARRARRAAAAANRAPAALIRLLGPADALRHGRFRHQEGRGRSRRWSGRRPPAASARPARARSAPGWQHRNSRLEGVVACWPVGGRGEPLSAGRRATVSSRRRRAVSLRSWSVSRRGRDGDQPAPRVVRDPVGRPLRGGGEQRLLHRVLAGVELAVAADQRAEDLRRESRSRSSTSGVPVTSPSRRRSGPGAPRPARGRPRGRGLRSRPHGRCPSQSMRKNPARCSLASANGPSPLTAPAALAPRRRHATGPATGRRAPPTR